MKFTDKNKHYIRTLINNGRHTRVNVITKEDVTHPYTKGDDLYLPEYDDYSYMFMGVDGVKCIDVTRMRFNTKYWQYMFADCKDLETVLFGDVPIEYNDVHAECMFAGCPKLKMVDLSDFWIKCFDAPGLLDEDTNVTDIYMPTGDECAEVIPYKDIRVYMGSSDYHGQLDELVYGEHEGRGPTFVIPEKVWGRMEPWQYEHLTDGYTIEIVE